MILADHPYRCFGVLAVIVGTWGDMCIPVRCPASPRDLRPTPADRSVHADGGHGGGTSSYQNLHTNSRSLEGGANAGFLWPQIKRFQISALHDQPKQIILPCLAKC